MKAEPPTHRSVYALKMGKSCWQEGQISPIMLLSYATLHFLQDGIGHEDITDLLGEWASKVQFKVLSWKELSSRKSNSGRSEQDFWRVVPNRAQLYTDDDLIEQGILISSSQHGLIHIAYVPWRMDSDLELGKENWDRNQWTKLENHIRMMLRHNSEESKNFKWEGLTLEAHTCLEMLPFGMKKCHIVGEISLDRIPAQLLSTNFFQGNISGSVVEVNNVFLTGNVNCHGRLSVKDSVLYKLNYAHSESRVFPVQILSSRISYLNINRDLESLIIDELICGDLIAENITIGKVNISNLNCSGSFRMSDSNIQGRFVIEGSDFPLSSHGKNLIFDHTKFSQKLLIRDSKLEISCLATSQLDSTVDFEFMSGSVEDAFEAELRVIRALKMAGNPSLAEVGRRQLERSCQLICDRHRQDGRKDLEHRFRRMEIKARSRRIDAEGDVKLVSLFYDVFSDFGRSLARPIAGALGIFVVFGLFYWISGSLVRGLSFTSGGVIDSDALTHAALLSVDKMFPFGASIDEVKLFDSQLVGERAGAWGVLMGFVGFVQTLLSGVMFFLAGLSIRTKLLIG